MPDFLDLPREVRDAIYEAIIDSGCDAPASPASTYGKRTHVQNTRGPFPAYSMSFKRIVKFPRPRQQPPFLDVNIALSCHQVYGEYMSALRRSLSKGLNYKLDVMIDEDSIYPTWTSLPVLSSTVDVLQLDFRLFTGRETARSHSPVGQDYYHTGGYLVDNMWQMLVVIACHGPPAITQDFNGQYRELRPMESIGTLILNVITPPSIDPDMVYGWIRASPARPPKPAANATIPQILTTSIAPALREFCTEGYGSLQSSILRTSLRSDRIKICVDGHLLKEWDLKNGRTMVA